MLSNLDIEYFKDIIIEPHNYPTRYVYAMLSAHVGQNFDLNSEVIVDLPYTRDPDNLSKVSDKNKIVKLEGWKIVESETYQNYKWAIYRNDEEKQLVLAHKFIPNDQDKDHSLKKLVECYTKAFFATDKLSKLSKDLADYIISITGNASAGKLAQYGVCLAYEKNTVPIYTMLLDGEGASWLSEKFDHNVHNSEISNTFCNEKNLNLNTILSTTTFTNTARAHNKGNVFKVDITIDQSLKDLMSSVSLNYYNKSSIELNEVINNILLTQMIEAFNNTNTRIYRVRDWPEYLYQKEPIVEIGDTAKQTIINLIKTAFISSIKLSSNVAATAGVVTTGMDATILTGIETMVDIAAPILDPVADEQIKKTIDKAITGVNWLLDTIRATTEYALGDDSKFKKYLQFMEDSNLSCVNGTWTAQNKFSTENSKCDATEEYNPYKAVFRGDATDKLIVSIKGQTNNCFHKRNLSDALTKFSASFKMEMVGNIEYIVMQGNDKDMTIEWLRLNMNWIGNMYSLDYLRGYKPCLELESDKGSIFCENENIFDRTELFQEIESNKTVILYSNNSMILREVVNQHACKLINQGKIIKWIDADNKDSINSDLRDIARDELKINALIETAVNDDDALFESFSFRLKDFSEFRNEFTYKLLQEKQNNTTFIFNNLRSHQDFKLYVEPILPYVKVIITTDYSNYSKYDVTQVNSFNKGEAIKYLSQICKSKNIDIGRPRTLTANEASLIVNTTGTEPTDLAIASSYLREKWNMQVSTFLNQLTASNSLANFTLTTLKQKSQDAYDLLLSLNYFEKDEFPLVYFEDLENVEELVDQHLNKMNLIRISTNNEIAFVDFNIRNALNQRGNITHKLLRTIALKILLLMPDLPAYSDKYTREDFEKTAKYFFDAKKVADDLIKANDSFAVGLHLKLALYYRASDQISTAIHYCEEAYTVFKNITSQYYLTHSIDTDFQKLGGIIPSYLGYMHKKLEDSESQNLSIKYCNESLQELSKINISKLEYKESTEFNYTIIQSAYCIASFFHKLGDSSNALQYYYKALFAVKDISIENNKLVYTNILDDITHAHFKIGNIAASIKCCAASQKIRAGESTSNLLEVVVQFCNHEKTPDNQLYKICNAIKSNRFEEVSMEDCYQEYYLGQSSFVEE